MAEVFDTYMNYGFSDAARIHVAEKPVDINTFIDPERKVGTAAISSLVEVVIACHASEINDDYVKFSGVVQEPPAYRGQKAELQVQWQKQDSRNSTLTIY